MYFLLIQVESLSLKLWPRYPMPGVTSEWNILSKPAVSIKRGECEMKEIIQVSSVPTQFFARTWLGFIILQYCLGEKTVNAICSSLSSVCLSDPEGNASEWWSIGGRDRKGLKLDVSGTSDRKYECWSSEQQNIAGVCWKAMSQRMFSKGVSSLLMGDCNV